MTQEQKNKIKEMLVVVIRDFLLTQPNHGLTIRPYSINFFEYEPSFDLIFLADNTQGDGNIYLHFIDINESVDIDDIELNDLLIYMRDIINNK